MSDFLKWLYPRYIKPYLDNAPQDGYKMYLSLLELHDKALEFTAIHAFLLGLRTGRGLPE